tara:strand:- start:1354 stop:1683 length:330 start_codon:yes stop_codon:yes gene_type:complete
MFGVVSWLDRGGFVDLIQAVAVLALSQGLFFVLFAWYLLRRLDDLVEELDARLAGALQATISSLPIGDIEPPNPLLAILAQHLQSGMQKPDIVEAVIRDKKGQFVSNND